MDDRDTQFIAHQAKIGYTAYRNHADGKSLVTGSDLPVWENLPQNIQDAWKCTAEAILFQ